MIFLIDYENVHNSGLTGIEKLSGNDQLVFFLKESDSFSAANHIKLEQSPVKKEYFFVPSTAKNALDFQLVAYLGIQCEKNKDEKYSIISNDQGYDAAISFLNKAGYDITRGNQIKTIYSQQQAAAEEKKKKQNGSGKSSKKEEDTAGKAVKSEKISNQKIKNLVSDLSSDQINRITQIVNNYKTKQAIHKSLVKEFCQEPGTKVYKTIKPLLSGKS